MHHFDLKDQKRVVLKVAGTMSRARLNKTGRSVAFIGGDFNFVVKGEKPSRVGIDGTSFPAVIDSGVHAERAKIWAPALDESVELFQAEPTRLGKASNREGQ